MAQVKNMSLFKRTGLLVFLLYGIIALLTSALTAYTLFDRMKREYVSKGSAIATAIAGASQEILLGRDAATVQSMIDQYLQIEGVAYVFVTDEEEQVMSHTFVPEMPRALRELHGDLRAQVVEQLVVPPYGNIIDISAPVLAGVAGYVHVGMDEELIWAYFWEAVMKMQMLLLLLFVVSLCLLYLISRTVTRPLLQLTEYARKLAAHDFDATLDIRTKGELDTLARSMQSMGQELSILFSEMESEVAKATGNLRDNMAYLSAIIDNLADGLLVVGIKGEITVINPAMRYLLDIGEMDCRGLDASAVLPPELMVLVGNVKACSCDVTSSEVTLSRGRVGQAISSCVTLDRDAEQCLGGVILIRDITREKELDQLKTDFISTVSHELRTPMTSVLGFTKIIRKKLEESVFPAMDIDNSGVRRPVDQVRGNMNIIIAEAERLTELINDVLDIARMEAGEVQWRDRDISLADVVWQSREATRGLWESKGLEVVVDMPDELPLVYGDHDRLVQVVVNLLSNAIKFTRKSPILCSVIRAGGELTVSVTDQGEGINPSALETIFEKFKQVGDTLTGKPTGTGLGLPICLQIVERHGGRIWAESTMGKGSTFRFTVPVTSDIVQDTEEPVACAVEPSGVSGMCGTPLVLVVDDDPSLSSYLRQVFEGQGFEVYRAGDGKEAVALAERLVPDLITMDIMMPRMDGHEAIRRLRANPATGHIPILVITALNDPEDDGDLSLTKPVEEEKLVESAKALLERNQTCRSCLVLGDPEECDVRGLSVLCTGDILFSSVDDFWEMAESGFSGTVFIPSEEHGKVELERLTRLPGISVVILPCYDCV